MLYFLVIWVLKYSTGGWPPICGCRLEMDLPRLIYTKPDPVFCKKGVVSLCRRSGLNPWSHVTEIFLHKSSPVSLMCKGMILFELTVWGFGGFWPPIWGVNSPAIKLFTGNLLEANIVGASKHYHSLAYKADWGGFVQKNPGYMRSWVETTPATQCTFENR